MPTRNIETLIQRQIHNWHRWRELMQLAPEPEKVKPRPIIAISRELGSGGRVLANALAERLDLQVHGYSLIDEIARDRNLEQRIVAQLDERLQGEIELWVQGMLNRRLFTKEQYYVSLVKAVRTLAAHGGVVIIGRGAHIILADTCALRVRLVAAADSRVRNLMSYEQIDEATARARIVESDAARAAFLKKLFGVDANDPHDYDLMVNTDRVPLPRVVEVAMAMLEARGVFAS
jgi:cytidylate kinase